MKTQVCITVDVEFSIGGAFESPDRYRPLGEEVVQCMVEGEEHGLGFILDRLARYGMSGTFFTEALQTTYFGDNPMADFAHRIAAAGHDVQLHLHPCWLHFQNSNWKEPGFIPNDYCSGKTDAELDQMIRLGLDVFSRWGIKRPVALRTGGFRTDRAVYRAMARAGLDLASNIGLAVSQPNEPELRVSGGQHIFDGVLEVPVLSYLSRNLYRFGKRSWRLFAITATSKAEIESLLWAARKGGARSVTALTHPFEFIKQNGFRYNRLQPNNVNQARFEYLLNFLKQNSDDFEVVTFVEKRQEWHQNGTLTATTLRTPLRFALHRTAQNAINHFTIGG